MVIDTISEYLGNTNDDGALFFQVPDWGLGIYEIQCNDGEGGSTDSVLFAITSLSTTLPLPQDYFGDWQPPWLAPLSDYADFVASTENRFTRRVVIRAGGTNLELLIEAQNSNVYNRFIEEGQIFFEVRSAPIGTPFNLRTDNVQRATECPQPPAMATEHLGRVLPSPPIENRLRRDPGLNGAIIDTIEPGGEFFVMDGPVCEDGIYWWYVESFNGKQGWTAEGNGEIYYTESYPELDIQITASGNFSPSSINVLYFFIDPSLNENESHRYRSDSQSASIRARVNAGEVRVIMWRRPFGYYGASSAGSNSYTAWLQHSSSSDDTTGYSAVVRGLGNGNTYSVQGTFVLD